MRTLCAGRIVVYFRLEVVFVFVRRVESQMNSFIVGLEERARPIYKNMKSMKAQHLGPYMVKKRAQH